MRDARYYVAQLEEVDKAIADFLSRFERTLNTIPSVSDTTVAKLLSEIGDIRRFHNADKLADFTGIASVNFSSTGNNIFPCHSDDSAVLQGLTEKSYFLFLLLAAVGKRRDQATGIDIDFQTVN